MPLPADYYAQTPDAPYGKALAITTSDATNLTYTTRAVYVGGAGNITAVMQSGDVVLFTAVPVGTTLRIRATRINATGTTATALVALF